jgi:hypothetical protein
MASARRRWSTESDLGCNRVRCRTVLKAIRHPNTIRIGFDVEIE